MQGRRRAVRGGTAGLGAIVRAAHIACLHEDVVGLAMGYDTQLGDAGSGLSGAQRQRLAIARAVATAALVLLLDEATSQLDVLTERHISANLDALACTRIVIAHRLSTVRDAALIVVLDGGRVVEQGTHELLGAGGLYAALVTATADADP